MTLHLGVTGTRLALNYETANAVSVEILCTLAEAGDDVAPHSCCQGVVSLHHGCCQGMDGFCHYLAMVGAARMMIDKVHMHWPDKPDYISANLTISPKCVEYAGKPYRLRNQDIVNACDVLVACVRWPEDDRRSKRSGTWQTIRMARAAHKPVRIVTWIPAAPEYI